MPRPETSRQAITSWCDHCNKPGFHNRREARQAMRRHDPGVNMRAYQCDKATDLRPLWHYGRLPTSQVKGVDDGLNPEDV